MRARILIFFFLIVCFFAAKDAALEMDPTFGPQAIFDDKLLIDGYAQKYSKEPLSILLAMIRKSQLLVGHNIQFDKFIARIAMRRFELITDEDDAAWKATPTFCTMREMTNVCQLPGKFAGKFKWPNLGEACQHIGKPLVGAHDAMADLRACKEVYFWLKARKA